MALKRKWVRWAILGAAAALLIALVVLLEPWGWQKLDLDRLTQLNQTSIVYDASGERAGSLYGSENRVYVTLDKIPLHVQQAFIAAEDQRFYEHPGVDVVRMFGALWHDIRTMSLEQGASTITQQLIKLTHLSGEKTLSRKAQEAVLALQLERQMDLSLIHIFAEHEQIDKGRERLGVEGAGASADDEGAGGALGAAQRYAGQIQRFEDVAEAHLVLQGDAQEVELAHRRAAFEREQGHVLRAHQRGHVHPRGKRALAEGVFARVDGVIEDLHAQMGHADLCLLYTSTEVC